MVPPANRVTRHAAVVLSLAAIACGVDRTAPTQPRAVPRDPLVAISDGAHQGNTHFYFLPPLVPAPTYSGTSDGTLLPTVSVCEWNATTSHCGTIVAQFSTGAGTGSTTLRYDATAQQYIVNWKTDVCVTGPCSLDPAKQYRLRVTVGAAELGFADVAVVENAAALKNVKTGETIGLVEGRTLPVKFRIEQGAVSIVGGSGGSAASVGSSGGSVTTDDGSAALDIPPSALGQSTPITISTTTGPNDFAPTVDLGPNGTQFTTPVTLTLPYEPSRLPAGVLPADLAIYTYDGQGWIEVPNGSVDEANATISVPISHFSSYSVYIRPNTVTGTPTPTTLKIGQSTVATAYAWYYYTVPGRQYCYPVYTYQYSWGQWYRYVSGWQCYSTPTQVYSYPVGGMAVFWSSSNAAVAPVSVGPTYTNGNGAAQSPAIQGVKPGAADIRGTIYGAVSSPLTITVLGQLGMLPKTANAVAGWSVRQQVTQTVALPNDLTFSLTNRNTFLVVGEGGTANYTYGGQTGSYVLSAGSQSKDLIIAGLNGPGVDTLIASAAGFTPDTAVITLVKGQFIVAGLPTTLAQGDSAAITLTVADVNGALGNLAYPIDVTLGGGPGIAYSDGHATIPTIRVPQRTSAIFYVKATAAGGQGVRITHRDYIDYNNAITVAPSFATIEVQPNPAGMRPGESVQLTATARDGAGHPVAGITPAWSSSNTGVATVDANGRVTGVANGTAVITASKDGVNGTGTVKVGTPTIGVSPSSVTIPVQQGNSNQAQISITNTGTGLLTGLATGPFSNYYNGSPAPWVTASLSSTTAPAILTIVAAPGLTIPPDVHKLRFDLSAPGATNSPVTFYSIDITVIAAGVTPVNATISPNPGSLSFSVMQGQSVSRQITISNSGTDPLTNISAGPFSNYFNGSPAPWVTAAVSPTTAPATVTVTAAPDLNTATGTHQLRFDVTSPGATNSPYTFFSINVTVTPAPTFSLTDLGVIAGQAWSEARAINGAGRIVGQGGNGFPSWVGFYWDPGMTAIKAIPNPYNDWYDARDVNEAGTIAAGSAYVGYLFQPGPTPADPGVVTQVPAVLPSNRNGAFGINNTGLVLACRDNGQAFQNYVWDRSASTTTLVPNAFRVCTGKINDQGLAITSADAGAGGGAWLWNQSTQAVTAVPVAGLTIGTDINASGVVVGYAQNGGQTRAFRWTPGQPAVEDLGTLGGTQSAAMGINTAGVIVGWSLTAAGQKHAFMWDPASHHMTDLGALSGYTESSANDINDHGVIVGSSGPSGASHATRWTPVP